MIAFLINELDIRGGTHKQFLKLLEYTDSRNVDFYVVTKKLDFDKTYPGFRRFADRIKVLPLKTSSSFWGKLLKVFATPIAVRKIIAQADVVNIHDCGFEYYLPAFMGKKTFWQINDLPSFYGVGVAKGMSLSLKDRLLKMYISMFSSVITDFSVNVSKNRERILQIFHKDAHVFYCGIEPVGIVRNLLPTLTNFKNKSINILTSGVFFPYRNYETQIAVVKALQKKGIDVHLNIIGSTEMDKQYARGIQTLIDKEGLNKNITICGQVDEGKFRLLHEAADIFIFINIDQSWGLAVFEAMSCGIPVIVSNNVGATEILSDGKNAIFVNPKDYENISDIIISLMTDEEKYIQLANESKKFHESYSWNDAYCSKMLDLIVK